MDLDMGLLLGIVGMALLFSLVGVLPLAHRSCGDCGGDCASCEFDPPPTGSEP